MAGCAGAEGHLDRRRCATRGRAGADGIIVSNHGGRSLDSSVPLFGALPEVVDAAASKAAVMVDGGFRRGVDVPRRSQWAPRLCSWDEQRLYGLAAGGQAGVAQALAIFREEIDRSLALIGSRASRAESRPAHLPRACRPRRAAACSVRMDSSARQSFSGKAEEEAQSRPRPRPSDRAQIELR